MAKPPPAGEPKLLHAKPSRSRARRANEAARHLLYLFPLPSSRLGTVTRARSPRVGSEPRGCNPLQEVGTDPSPNPTRRERKGRGIKWAERTAPSRQHNAREAGRLT
ncbi:hypothetical protein AV530_019125 [Patagioenas fasciata monilis]|uniref:Uncharacterized protein n=1 Tax=Patagioenas fasciata monilis TaxID=372326 RepID=A0A1V4KX50_PATFA|nr:hypothetical protein AV530_019125 [Patagioenas fasciata monilis]